jgi:hypothetical protein
MTTDIISLINRITEENKSMNNFKRQIDARINEEDSRVKLMALYQLNGLSRYDRVQMPEKFDLSILYFSSDPSQGIENALDEYDVISSEWNNDITGYLRIKHNCCCSQTIERIFYARNRINGNILPIGSECINKFSDKPNQYDTSDGFVISHSEQNSEIYNDRSLKRTILDFFTGQSDILDHSDQKNVFTPDDLNDGEDHRPHLLKRLRRRNQVEEYDSYTSGSTISGDETSDSSRFSVSTESTNISESDKETDSIESDPGWLGYQYRIPIRYASNE